jgi:hypothetical protein
MSEFVCCDEPQLPHGVVVGHARLSGSLVATCNNCDFVSAYWDCPACDLSHACETEAECPNHNGSYDCTPFCELCEGSQMVPVLVGEG